MSEILNRAVLGLQADEVAEEGLQIAAVLGDGGRSAAALGLQVV